MAKDIKFRISLNIDGKEQLVTATTNVKEMRKRWDEAERSTQRFSRSLMNLENTFSMLEWKSRIIVSRLPEIVFTIKNNH